jgi:hypothetical protein
MTTPHHSFTSHRRRLAALLPIGVLFLATAARADGPVPLLWDALDAAQQAEVARGGQVRIDDPSQTYWQMTYYQWIRHESPLADPRGAAAVYWDLPGQASYQSQSGLIALDVTAGEGTAAIHAEVTVSVPAPGGGMQEITYAEECGLFRYGSGAGRTYQASWYVTDPARSIAPGMVVAFNGDVRFQHFPGDGGGALLVYRASAVPAAAIAGDPATREMVAAQLGAIVAAHVERMQKGPTPAQLHALDRALR